ncbi:FAD/NAD(P)-binding protein [Paracoccus aestuariivivens]|uniref:SidA/IucD/PvdA family monooxygenase n=1 Tax=Paracoccus aestuariivivens TaxID=1820333 RepID=A0A6L6J5F0_9RHOB|nr:FAD/NAD(P)-binding protein [Paracoccus aestuariivivens]MTH77140.1 SidA/IucD/PvdA family monooxygenase [Paracoccus aestuariivivens]
MTVLQSPRLRVVIIGGGFSGASLAWQLAEMRAQAVITVVEPRSELGRGLAYSTNEPTHRINVPAHRMSLDPERREDFLEWLTEAEEQGRLDHDRQSVTEHGERFPRREVFGRYVSERLAPHLETGTIRHIRARVGDVERALDGSLVLMLSDESRIRADIVVLATGHPAPAVPKPVAGLTGAAQLIADPYDPVRLAEVDKDARILVLGAALTSADVIATLDRLGHQGRITCISRHGLRSRGHGQITRDSQVDFVNPPIRRASELLRAVRHAVVDDQAQGQSWHATFYRLRQQGPQIWAGLDAANRARLLRHLRTLWDVHRYRLAPQVEVVLNRLVADGRLEYVAGHVLATERDGEAVRVSWRERGGETRRTESFDKIIVTTGPAQGRCIDWNPALGALARLGLVTPDPLGLGLATTETCRAIDASGAASQRVLIAGPLARGHIGELVGAPECAIQVSAIAAEIVKQAILAPILGPAAVAHGPVATPS